MINKFSGLSSDIKQYLVITENYWAFTLTVATAANSKKLLASIKADGPSYDDFRNLKSVKVSR